MSESARLLIVDDEPDIVNMLSTYFQGEGYKTVCATSADGALEAINAALAERPALQARRGSGIDLVLLDVNMPGMDGFTLCRKIREHLSCPIIFLTARVEDADQLDGFAAGADDYVLKPFSLAVLGGRVRAHLAREARRPEAAGSVRIFSGITIDYGKRTVTVEPPRGGTAERSGEGTAEDVAEGTARKRGERAVALELTRTEFDIVAMLSKNPGRVYDRAQIYEQVWDWDAEGDPGIVREHVRRIRRKFADAGCAQDPIGTVWGVGYKWEAR